MNSRMMELTLIPVFLNWYGHVTHIDATPGLEINVVFSWN